MKESSNRKSGEFEGSRRKSLSVKVENVRGQGERV